ncbi:MAG: hypothetical protein KJZ87_27415, partial [Thermoguttaceae bacterium]|nr:hypothetical protein [Thermoguttaceae bacterium]
MALSASPCTVGRRIEALHRNLWVDLDPADVVTVALMPCSAKKFECNRPEMCASGYKD